MNQTTTRPVGRPAVRTLDVPGACLHYEVRGAGPLAVLVGAPMDARSFTPLAELLAADHTVLTTDPRGIYRSSVTDPDADSTPAVRADDLARLIADVDAGPAAVVGSSGGATSALALAQLHPDCVRTVIAHEAPLDQLLEDRDRLRAETEEMVATYLSGDVIGAWRMFLDQADIVLPPGAFEEMFGGERDRQEAADERFWFEHEMRPSTWWLPDFDKLRAGGVRVVVGIGEDSVGELCERTSHAIATELGVEPVRFPGDHTGFTADAAAFAARLRTVL